MRQRRDAAARRARPNVHRARRPRCTGRDVRPRHAPATRSMLKLNRRPVWRPRTRLPNVRPSLTRRDAMDLRLSLEQLRLAGADATRSAAPAKMGTRPVARGDRRERTRPIRGSARPGSGRNDLVLRWCVRRNYGSNGPSSERESRGESDNDGGNHQAPLVVWAFTRGGRRARRTKMGSDLAVKPPSIIAPVGIANGPAGGLQGAMMLGQRASSKASDIA